MVYSDKYKFLPNVNTHDVDIEHIFLHLTDTPSTFSGTGGYLLKINVAETGIEFVDPSVVPTSIIVEDEGSTIQNTPHTTLNFIGAGVTVSDAGGGVANITISGSGDSGVFGFNFYDASSEYESYTNSTEYVEKLKMSLSNIPAGKYRIGWFYEWAQENSNWRFESRVQLDDTTTLCEIKIRPSESSWESWETNSGFAYQTLTSGNHTVDIDYCTSKWNKTSGIRKARLEFWRVS